MELYFKQRLLSFFDSFDIYDEDDNVVYTVEGQPAWLHKLHVLNAAGEHIATVRQELSLLASFELLVGEESIGCVEQNFSLLRSSFTLDCYDWDIEGDVFGLDYSITASDCRSVAAFSKELFHWTDTYHLSVPREEDVLPAMPLHARPLLSLSSLESKILLYRLSETLSSQKLRREETCERKPSGYPFAFDPPPQRKNCKIILQSSILQF